MSIAEVLTATSVPPFCDQGVLTLDRISAGLQRFAFYLSQPISIAAEAAIAHTVAFGGKADSHQTQSALVGNAVFLGRTN